MVLGMEKVCVETSRVVEETGVEVDLVVASLVTVRANVFVGAGIRSVHPSMIHSRSDFVESETTKGEKAKIPNRSEVIILFIETRVYGIRPGMFGRSCVRIVLELHRFGDV